MMISNIYTGIYSYLRLNFNTLNTVFTNNTSRLSTVHCFICVLHSLHGLCVCVSSTEGRNTRYFFPLHLKKRHLHKLNRVQQIIFKQPATYFQMMWRAKLENKFLQKTKKDGKKKFSKSIKRSERKWRKRVFFWHRAGTKKRK